MFNLFKYTFLNTPYCLSTNTPSCLYGRKVSKEKAENGLTTSNNGSQEAR